jgi:hypothetical protein
MKKNLFVILLMLFGTNTNSQNLKVFDYQFKTEGNSKDRTEMLDALRAYLNRDLNMILIFTVDHFKVSENYAWLEGTANRKDGEKIESTDVVPYDCCHVEALFEKRNGTWMVADGEAFSTDVWYTGLGKKYPKVPRSIFPQNTAANFFR